MTRGWSLPGILCSSEVRIQDIIFWEIDLLGAGCGRFFEGTPAEMHKALNQTLASLPDDTKVYVSPLLSLNAEKTLLTDLAGS